MAAKHPYVSSNGVLIQVLDHLQKSFPTTFNAETLKKLGFAPSNESYIINVVRFLGLIDENDARTELAQKVFTLHEPESFKKAFGDVVMAAYKDLFSLHNEATWSLGDEKLVPFFRQTDQTSELVGSRQASSFRALASYAGHGSQLPIKQSAKAPKTSAKGQQSKSAKTSAPAKKGAASTAVQIPGTPPIPPGGNREFGLTVRIEINLPATGDQKTYDAIFKSIRENFLNA